MASIAHSMPLPGPSNPGQQPWCPYRGRFVWFSTLGSGGPRPMWDDHNLRRGNVETNHEPAPARFGHHDDLVGCCTHLLENPLLVDAGRGDDRVGHDDYRYLQAAEDVDNSRTVGTVVQPVFVLNDGHVGGIEYVDGGGGNTWCLVGDGAEHRDVF